MLKEYYSGGSRGRNLTLLVLWHHFHYVMPMIAADSRVLAMRQASSYHLMRGRLVLHELPTKHLLYFSSLYVWNILEQILDAHRATLPCVNVPSHSDDYCYVRHQNGHYGGYCCCWYFQAPNSHPQQRAFCFGVLLYSVNAVLEGKKLNVNIFWNVPCSKRSFYKFSWCNAIPGFLFFLKRQDVLKWHIFWPI